MKKIIAFILAGIMLLALVSCGGAKDDSEEGKETKQNVETDAQTDAGTEEATEPVSAGPIEPKIDEFLATYECVTHGKVDIMFNYAGASFTMENIAAVIKDAAGLGDSCTVEIDELVFEDIKEQYQGAGDGGGATGNGFLWTDPVIVTFSDPATGETVEREISFSFRKCLPSSEIYPNGVLGTCPEDGNAEMQMAYPKLNTVALSDEVRVYEGYDGEYTEEAVEAFFRELTGLTDADAYEFRVIGFDPETRGEVFWAMFIDKNAPDGKFDAVWVETAF